jgi:hypothetical protein
MKAHWGVYVQIHVFLTSAPIGGEWSASRPGRFTLGKELPVPIVYEVGWTPEPVGRYGEAKIIYPTLLRPLGRPASSQ